MDCGLSLEDRFQVRLLELEIESYSKERLVQRVLEEREETLMQGRYYRQVLEVNGFELVREVDVALVLPQSEEELAAVLGRRPSNQEVADYCNQRIAEHQEAARMDVDIEAIALETED